MRLYNKLEIRFIDQGIKCFVIVIFIIEERDL